MSATNPHDIVVIGAKRTPFAKLLGALSHHPATDLAGFAITAALKEAGVRGGEVDAVILGQVIQAGVGQNPARQAAQAAGIRAEAHTITVNKVCLSGLSAIIDAARLLRTGEANIVVAGGMESMSRAPHLLQLRQSTKFGSAEAVDAMLFDALTSPVDGRTMGQLVDDAAANGDATEVSRAEQDRIAAQSHQRAAAARDAGEFDHEIVAVPAARPDHEPINADEGIRDGADEAQLGKLKAVFRDQGSVTAGNASQISDGAAALVLCTREVAQQRDAHILAVVRSCGQIAGPTEALQDKPAAALKAALEREGWTAQELDLVEINEAFAAVVAQSQQELGLECQVNAHGGAIALGHPVGASGARLAVHAVHQLARRKAQRAGVSLCGGGGQGEALLFEANA